MGTQDSHDDRTDKIKVTFSGASESDGGVEQAVLLKLDSESKSGGGKTAQRFAKQDDESALPIPVDMMPLKDANDKMSWLLRFLKSDFFDTWIAITYLWKYNDPGVKDYLVNQMFIMDVNKLEFYIPQLVHMACLDMEQDGTVERLIRYQCRNHYNFACLVIWTLESNFANRGSNNMRLYSYELKERILYDKSKIKYLSNDEFGIHMTLRRNLREKTSPNLSKFGHRNSVDERGTMLNEEFKANLHVNNRDVNTRDDDSIEKKNKMSAVVKQRLKGHSHTHSLPGITTSKHNIITQNTARALMKMSGSVDFTNDCSSRFGSNDVDNYHYEDRLDVDNSLDSSSLSISQDESEGNVQGEEELEKKSLGNRKTNEIGKSYSSSCLPTLDGIEVCANENSPSKEATNGSAVENMENQSHAAIEHEQEQDRDIKVVESLSVELDFMSALMSIGNRLVKLKTKDMRKAQLYSEIQLLNMTLPARVFLPLYGTHHIVRIPPDETVILQSKDRAPFMIMVEVVGCDDVITSDIPPRLVKGIDRLRDTQKGGGRRKTITLFDEEGLVSENMYINNKEEQKLFFKQLKNRSNSVKMDNSCIDLNAAHHGKGRGNIQDMFLSARSVRDKIEEQSKRPGNKGFQGDDSVPLLQEDWESKKERIRQSSPYGSLPNWRLENVIVKSGDDLRQEVLAAQLINQFKQIWEEDGCRLWLHFYRVLVTCKDGGLIETVHNAISIHSLKKQTGISLREHFIETYGHPRAEGFLKAQQNFIESFSAYSLVCYFLQIKDRHNGNILLTNQGHIVHIDFGFFLSNSPRNLGFESASFKFNKEYVDVMGGLDGDMYQYFRMLMMEGFISARKHMDKIVILVEIMQKGSNLDCFYGKEECIRNLKNRFHFSLTETQLVERINGMIDQSMGSYSTKLYDDFQYYTNGIL